MDGIEIEMFRADTKASKGLTAAHIEEAAKLYNPELAPAPLVFGHPAADSPALGIVEKVRTDGAKLFGTLKGMSEELVKAVRDRRVLSRSIAFWAPDHPSNPNPGKYSIRHLGFLGGQAPAIPNMPALRFSADETALESDEAPGEALVYAVEDDEPTPVKIVTDPKPKKEFAAMDEAAIKAAQEANETEARRLKAEGDKLATAQQEFAASAARAREAENTAVIDKAVEQGKVLPAEKDDLAKIFNALPVQALTFSAGELEPRAVLGSFLDKLPKRAPVKEPPTAEGKDFAADGGDAKAAADAALAASNAKLKTAYQAAGNA